MALGRDRPNNAVWVRGIFIMAVWKRGRGSEAEGGRGEEAMRGCEPCDVAFSAHSSAEAENWSELRGKISTLRKNAFNETEIDWTPQ